MRPEHRHGITLGPLFLTIADGAVWRDDPTEECFPSRQYIADELERYLAFVYARGQFERFLPRLRDNRRRRDAAFREIAAAFMFTRDGLDLIEWEPIGRSVSGHVEDSKRGEFMLSTREGERIFVEVKGPDWEGELAPEERSTRKLQPKHRHLEARAFDNTGAIRHAVEQASDKFTGGEPSLLVIVDDFFVSLEHQTWACDVALYSPQMPGWTEGGYLSSDGSFATDAFDRVGGLMVLWVDRDESRHFDQVAFGTRLYLNPHAVDAVRLPQTFSRAYRGIDRPEYK